MVTILEGTTRNPITLIGKMAGICWGSETTDDKKNYERGMNCIEAGHGRTFEFPDVYMSLQGYSARVIREWYTHLGGAPTRLQQSTRYINYGNFEYITPPSIANDPGAKKYYDEAIENIKYALDKLDANYIPREDAALLLPLGMRSDIVCKHNFRNLMDMSRQRMCGRAYHEYRKLFSDLYDALAAYSEEWKTLCQLKFFPKCKELGYCPEKQSCGRYAGKDI